MTPLERSKLCSLVHYIVSRVDNPALLGATKLQKIIWFSEGARVLHGLERLTPAKFVRRQHGPFSGDIEFALELLKQHGAIAEARDRDAQYAPREFRSLRQPDMSLLAKDEIATIDDEIARISLQHSATSVSQETHDGLWEAMTDGDEMPPSIILAKDLRPSTTSEIEWVGSLRDSWTGLSLHDLA